MPLLPPRPFVSFVLATYNRGTLVVDCLRQTLATAAASLGENHFNIHVVDNASTDNTPALLTALAHRHSQIHVHHLSRNCGPVAKNIALHGNTADLIVLLDDDAYPRPGALARMVHHFQDDPQLGAAVFDVTLPDGRKEGSAYPDVFIGAGTALRGAALRALPNVGRPGRNLLPADFFMQAEEYDLSFRLLDAGWSIQRFWDMPLMHLKAPGARIGTRTTRLDVRNNLWLLARYLPQPLAAQLAADWLARYWRMAQSRDLQPKGHAGSHRAAHLRGMAEGLLHWNDQRQTPLAPATIERIFKFNTIRDRLARAREQLGLQRIALGDWGKNMLAFHRAALNLNLKIVAVIEPRVPASDRETAEYRGIPLVDASGFRARLAPHTDAIVLTQMSRPHAERRAAEMRRTFDTPILDLFSKAPLPQARPAVPAGAF